jgi:hypothetical protein
MARAGVGFFATGPPELPVGAAPEALPAELTVAVISRERARHLSEFLHAPVGQILHHLGHAARR